MKYVVFSSLFAMLLPFTVSAASLQTSGWIPWWAGQKGATYATEHIQDFTLLSPFIYEVGTDGSIIAKSDIKNGYWEDLRSAADKKDVAIVPTIVWSDGAAIHEILSHTTSRTKHVAAITALVSAEKYDGIDIDYEAKKAETKESYSLFLKELRTALAGKTLACTLEARTPTTSRFKVVPSTLEYANDFAAIGKVCDRVELMAYDQGRVDILLNESKSGEPYIPTADAVWVEKLIVLALQDIPKEKLVLGVPSYGYEWTVEVAPNWYKSYTKVRSVSVAEAVSRAKEYKVTPSRNKAGEMSFSYYPTSSIFAILNQLPAPAGTRTGNEAAAKALFFASATGMSVPVNVVWYPDATAREKLITLAKQYNLLGTALFKIDGE